MPATEIFNANLLTQFDNTHASAFCFSFRRLYEYYAIESTRSEHNRVHKSTKFTLWFSAYRRKDASASIGEIEFIFFINMVRCRGSTLSPSLRFYSAHWMATVLLKFLNFMLFLCTEFVRSSHISSACKGFGCVGVLCATACCNIFSLPLCKCSLLVRASYIPIHRTCIRLRFIRMEILFEIDSIEKSIDGIQYGESVIIRMEEKEIRSFTLYIK